MARLVRIPGIASLLIVEDDQQIEDLMGHPALERDFELKGPLLNRIIIARLKNAFMLENKMMLSMRPRVDAERKTAQANLKDKLDRYAAVKSWAPEAVEAVAAFVRSGENKKAANAALAYDVAFPFLADQSPSGEVPFDVEANARIFKQYRRLSLARQPFSLRGAIVRLTGSDMRARKAILKHVSGDQYGLHAIAITLDNAIVTLDKMRHAFEAERAKRKRFSPFRWINLRTAPQTVLRQIKTAYNLPYVDQRLPAHTLVMFRMRDALRSDSFSGFEFAARQWSACPAQHYLLSYFAAVWSAALFPKSAQDIYDNPSMPRVAQGPASYTAHGAVQ